MSTTAAAMQITDQQRRHFQEEGYFLLERVVPEEHLELLRGQCQHFINRSDREMDKLGVSVRGLDHKGKRYFASTCVRERPEMRAFVFSDLMAEVCRATLGDNAFLFWDQYVVKCADKGMKFSWHQDSGYVHPKAKPYLSCWITLDDVSEENGTVYLLPYSRSGIRTWVQHVKDPTTNDLVGYFGSDRGVPVIAPAGSIAVFSSFLFHSSGANTTNKMRRIYLAQYSSEIIMSEDGTKPWGQTERFLNDGKNIAEGNQ